MEIRMRFYVTRTRDGLIHVQNAVMGQFGQHHVHTKAGYLEWKKQVPSEDVIELRADGCDCGLGEGEVRDHDGRVWRDKNELPAAKGRTSRARKKETGRA